MYTIPLVLPFLLSASIFGKAHSKIVVGPHLTTAECVVGANCTIEWLTDDCDQTQKVREFSLVRMAVILSGVSMHCGLTARWTAVREAIQLDNSYAFLDNVQENSCMYTMIKAETGNFRSNERYDIFMAPFDAAYPEDRWNYDSDIRAGVSFDVSATASESAEVTKNPPACQRPLMLPDTFSPESDGYNCFDDPKYVGCRYWYWKEVVELIKTASTITGIGAFYLGVGFAMLVYVLSLWTVRRTRSSRCSVIIPPSTSPRSADPEAARAELDVQPRSTWPGGVLNAVHEPHPGIPVVPVVSDEVGTTTKASSPVSQIHELAASPTQQRDGIWQGPGIATINTPSVNPVTGSHDAAKPAELTNGERQPITEDSGHCRLQPEVTKHLSPNPIKHQRKASKEPDFEMLTLASIGSNP
ncbi:uncharacterized protein AB675_849 [Cyphellophora attinorum]|uniref:Uncharacterized protein n=1 Tax=Cyphellophora attinorum TaxID=1664694 RepID=A0A0N1HGQ5_9EURO|nr:uncharacterized protein AB675_849 [Phialophora attinorum]KPI45447.1 hypothetical protein AB675_849 [Phialophora attinorum]